MLPKECVCTSARAGKTVRNTVDDAGDPALFDEEHPAGHGFVRRVEDDGVHEGQFLGSGGQRTQGDGAEQEPTGSDRRQTQRWALRGRPAQTTPRHVGGG